MTAAEEAFDRYHRAVFDFVYRMTNRADVAEDITQDCFMALVKSPARFDGTRSSLKTYLFAIARNMTMARARNAHRESQLDDGCPVFRMEPSSELSLMVSSAVAMLPHFQQEALVLFEYEGFTLEEIAVVAEVDVGSVKSRLHRARQNLKRMLEPIAVKENAHGTT